MPDQDATQAALTQPIPAGTPMLDGFNPEGKTVGDYIEFANNQYKHANSKIGDQGRQIGEYNTAQATLQAQLQQYQTQLSDTQRYKEWYEQYKPTLQRLHQNQNVFGTNGQQRPSADGEPQESTYTAQDAQEMHQKYFGPLLEQRLQQNNQMWETRANEMLAQRDKRYEQLIAQSNAVMDDGLQRIAPEGKWDDLQEYRKTTLQLADTSNYDVSKVAADQIYQRKELERITAERDQLQKDIDTERNINTMPPGSISSIEHAFGENFMSPKKTEDGAHLPQSEENRFANVMASMKS